MDHTAVASYTTTATGMPMKPGTTTC